MYLVTLNVDGREWPCRTEILTSSTADALAFVYGWDVGSGLVAGMERHHLYGSRRTMARTVATFDAIGKNHAVFLYPNGMTYLCAGLLLLGNGTYSPCGAYLRATVALGTAVAAFVRHRGLHHRKEPRAGTKHAVGALGYAELTACAVL